LHGELRKPAKNITLYFHGGLKNYMENIASVLAWWTAKTHENYSSYVCLRKCMKIVALVLAWFSAKN
jgi:hypothetical protein